MKRWAAVWIVLAGCFWGSMGVFVRALTGYGFSTLQIAALRLCVAFLVLLAGVAIVRPALLKFRLRDLLVLAPLGAVSIGAMSVLYFTTIQLSSLATAAILLYLSPVAVTVMSALFLRERITPKKVIAMLMAVCGCALVAGITGGAQIGFTALLTGIGSAVTYGSYSILGAKALEKYHPFTVTTVAFGVAAVLLLALCKPTELIAILAAAEQPLTLWGWIIATGVATAVIPFTLYTIGLRDTEASKAAVLACSEPVAATLFGLAVFREQPPLPAYAGMVLVLAAIVLLNLSPRLTRKNNNP